MVGGFVFGGGDMGELTVEAALVEPVDVFGDGDLDVVDAGPGVVVADQFGLEEAVERFGEGVVVGVAL